MKKQTILLTTFIALLAVLIIGGTTYTGLVVYEPEQKPLRILGSEFPSNRFFVLAEEKGFFEDEGTKAVVLDIPDDQAVQAFAAGELDFLHVSPDWHAILKSQGVEGTQILFFEIGEVVDGMVASKEINKVKDLKGKKVAAWEGTLLHFQLLLMLDEAGLTQDDVEIVSLSPDKAMIAFISEDVDAAAAYEPWLSQYKERSGAKIIYSDKDSPIPIMSSLIASDKIIKERPEDVKAVMRSFFKAVEYWEQNPAESNQLMGKSIGISGDDFAYFMSMTRILDYRESLSIFKSGTADIIRDKVNEIWINAKIIEKPLTQQEFYNPTLLETLY